MSGLDSKTMMTFIQYFKTEALAGFPRAKAQQVTTKFLVNWVNYILQKNNIANIHSLTDLIDQPMALQAVLKYVFCEKLNICNENDIPNQNILEMIDFCLSNGIFLLFCTEKGKFVVLFFFNFGVRKSQSVFTHTFKYKI